MKGLRKIGIGNKNAGNGIILTQDEDEEAQEKEKILSKKEAK